MSVDAEPQSEKWKQWKALGAALESYWAAYGGWHALKTSPFFWLSIVFTLLVTPTWRHAGWWDTVNDAIPSLLGFSLGGMAILLAFGDDDFRKLTARAGGEWSPFVKMSAAFLHFIVVQTLAWLAALFCRAWYGPIHEEVYRFATAFGLSEWGLKELLRWTFWGPSYFLFIYAIATGLAATLRIFQSSVLFSKVVKKKAEDDAKKKADEDALRRKDDEANAIALQVFARFVRLLGELEKGKPQETLPSPEPKGRKGRQGNS